MYTHREGAIILLEDSLGRIAFQLRDDKPEVVGRNCWGLFGGLSEQHESPGQTVIREISEELGYRLESSKLTFLKSHCTNEELKSYIFHYPISDELDGTVLKEGQALQFMTSTDLVGKRVIPHHLEIVEWYWRQKGE